MSGEIWRWGGALYGGIPSVGYVATQFGTHTDIVAISGFNRHGLYIRSDGTLWGFGENTEGQVGDGTTSPRSSPVQIGTDTDWQSLASIKGFSSAAIKSDGTLWVWGRNSGGQLGIGDTGVAKKLSPFQLGIETTWVKVSCGQDHMLGLKADGTLWAWGWNYSGQLGLNDTTSRASPVQVGSATDWVDVDAGVTHSVGRRSGGTLWVWGSNNAGQLGDGSTTQRPAPVQITGTTWDVISAGWDATLATKTDGTAWFWGDNAYAQLGNGSATAPVLSPTQVGSATDWLDVTCGAATCAGKKTNSDVYLWGDNYNLQTYSSGALTTPTLSLKSAADATVLFSAGTMGVELYVPPAEVLLADSVTASDASQIGSVLAALTIYDTATASSWLQDGQELIAESITASDTALPESFAVLREAAIATESYSASTLRAHVASDSATLGDEVVISVAALLTESASAIDAALTIVESEVNESAAASDVVTTSASTSRMVADSAVAVDETLTGEASVVSELATAADATTTVFACLLSESAAASDATLVGATDDDTVVADVALIGDEVAIQITSVQHVSELVAALDSVSYKQPGAVAWLMNTESGGASWYSNYQFTDIAQVGNLVLAVGPEGLSLHEGALDSGDTVDAGVTWGFTEFGGYDREGNPKENVFKKRVSDFWLGYTSDGVLEASVETYKNGDPVYTYEMPQRDAEQSTNNCIKPGLGLNARYWRIGINNVGGCDFAVDSLIAHVAQSTRRI